MIDGLSADQRRLLLSCRAAVLGMAAPSSRESWRLLRLRRELAMDAAAAGGRRVLAAPVRRLRRGATGDAVLLAP